MGEIQKRREVKTLTKDIEERRAKNRVYQQSLRERREAEISSLHTEIDTLNSSLEKALSALTSLCDKLEGRNVFHTNPAAAEPLYGALNDSLHSLGRDRDFEDGRSRENKAPKTTSPSHNDPTKRKPKRTPRELTSCAPTDIFSLATTFNVSTSLPLPKNYAYLESSFARQLYRSCFYYTLELLDPTASAESPLAARIFGLVTRFCRTDNIRKETLSKCFGPMMDNLDALDAPYLNIGGSGTHFPRLDIVGEPSLDERAWVVLARRYSTLNPDRLVGGAELDRLLAENDCEGEWFDPNDVEQYLRSNGVDLVGNPSTVRLFQGRRPYTLDVSRLVNDLTRSGVCLGRSPGFRRAQIQPAFARSLSVAVEFG